MGENGLTSFGVVVVDFALGDELLSGFAVDVEFRFLFIIVLNLSPDLFNFTRLHPIRQDIISQM